MTVTFHNVEITIEAETPEEAYDLLTGLLEDAARAGGLGYGTDTYTTDQAPDTQPRETYELWPDNRKANQ